MKEYYAESSTEFGNFKRYVIKEKGSKIPILVSHTCFEDGDYNAESAARKECEDWLKKHGECLHKECKDIGQTMYEGFPALTYWCPDCGAYKIKQNAGAYKNGPWNKPKNK